MDTPMAAALRRAGCLAAVLAAGLAVAPPVAAQSLGAYRWQQFPYCNVITLNVVQTGAVYQVDGFDDQCGAPTRASAAGLAVLNPNGTIGFGLTVVTPGGQPLHLDATIDLATVSGTWRDSSGNTGAWRFTPGAPLPGPARPSPRLTLNVGAYAATASGGAVTPGDAGCMTFSGTQSILRYDLNLPVGAVVSAVKIRFFDGSPSPMTVDVRAVDLSTAPPTDTSVITYTTQATGFQTQTLTLPSPVAITTTRYLYLRADGATVAAGLRFCGAQVVYAQ